MTSEQLASLAGVILSLAFSYVPGLSDKYSMLDSIKKSLIMLALIAVVAVGAFALSCAQVVNSVTCDKDGAMVLLNAFIAAAIANQVTYQLSPQKKATDVVSHAVRHAWSDK